MEVMTKQTPESSQVERMTYWPDTKILSIVYRPKQSEYEYKEVPQEIADQLWAAESVGKFLNREIKGKYQHTFIGDGK